MKDALNNALSRVLPVCGAALLAGCNVDLSGLNQLLDPDPTYLSLPGRRVASGEYSNIGIGGNDFEGAYVLGNEMVDETRTLAITPFEGGTTCKVNVGPKDRNYRAWQFGPRNPLGITFPFMVTTDKVAHLHFVNPSCEEMLPPLDADSLPFWPGTQPTESVPGYLTLERDGTPAPSNGPPA